MPEYDAVFVGSGVNSLASAALLSRAGWRVSVLERNDRLGGAIRTVNDLTEPGFTHEVLSSWHPLFLGSAAYAELGRGPRRARARVPQHRAPDGLAVPRRLGRVPLDLARRERRRVRAPRRRRRRGLEAPVRGVHGLGRAELRRALVRALVAAGPLARAHGLPPASAAAACSRSAAPRSRARATGSRRRSPRMPRAGCSRRGCCTPGSGPSRRCPAS